MCSWVEKRKRLQRDGQARPLQTPKARAHEFSSANLSQPDFNGLALDPGCPLNSRLSPKLQAIPKLQAFPSLLASARFGVVPVAAAVATVAAAEYVFATVVPSAADASVREVVVSVHWPAFVEDVDDPALVSSGVSGVL